MKMVAENISKPIGNDTIGIDTLKAIANAHCFNRWMFESIQPFIKGNILEIGSGLGNISSYLIQDQRQVTLSDVQKFYCDFLINNFKTSSYVKDILQLDLVAVDFDKTYGHLFNQFDTAFALNVIEHIQEDSVAITNLKKFLKPGGKMLILVPAHPQLYNSIDHFLQHFKRYKKEELELLLSKCGLKIERSFFFNSLGIVAWWLSGAIFKNKKIKNKQMNAYDYLVPLARILDKISGKRIGLSVISVAVKD